MTMTRRDFENLAHEINWRSDNHNEALKVVDIIAPALKRSAGLTPNGNSRFDYDRFLKAATERFTNE